MVTAAVAMHSSRGRRIENSGLRGERTKNKRRNGKSIKIDGNRERERGREIEQHLLLQSPVSCKWFTAHAPL